MAEQISKTEFQVEEMNLVLNQHATDLHDKYIYLIALTQLLVEKGIITDEEICEKIDATKYIIAENNSDG